MDTLRAEDFDAVFYPGGHGRPLWDLAEDPHSIALIEQTFADGKPWRPSAMRPAYCSMRKNLTAHPLVAGKRVTGFTNSEKQVVQLTKVVPFLVEDELRRLGGQFERTDDWQSYSVTDCHLVTYQNPALSTAVSRQLKTCYDDNYTCRRQDQFRCHVC